MALTHRLLTLLILSAAGFIVAGTSEARADSFETQQRRYARVRSAFKVHESALRDRFRAKGALWPPQDVFLRAYKDEGELELWAAGKGPGTQPLVRVHTFPICASSGVLGLKRQSGDGQVPEGFYRIDRFNPHSSYHLSLGLDYPNAWDKARARRDDLAPGGDIFVHGNCVTIGCLPLGDAAIEELYVVAVKARSAGQRGIHVAMAPCRFGTPTCEERLKSLGALDPDTRHVHALLRAAEAAFGATGRRPAVRVTAKGYTLTIPPHAGGGASSP